MRTSYPIRLFRLTLLLPVVLGISTPLVGQSAAALSPSSASASSSNSVSGQTAGEVEQGRLLLVEPFDNQSNQPNLDWIGEAVPEVLNRRLASAGFMPISREDRLYALDHLGLPESFEPSRASAIRLAQTLDANYLVVGSFSVAGSGTGSRFEVSAQILNLDALHMGPPIEEQADMSHLLEVLNSLAWQVAKDLNPSYAVAQTSFVAADSSLGIAAYENYIRGVIATDSGEQIRHLKEAVRLAPAFSPALWALGKAYFADQQYDLAASTLGRLTKDAPSAQEADFYRGLAYLYTGSYVNAEDAFAFVSERLPLPEVLNNEGVAASRRGKDGTPFFLRAVAADPNDPDYQFNLAVALDHKNDVAGALRAIGECLKLRGQDTEAQSFQAALRAKLEHSSSEPHTPAPPPNRVETDFAASGGDQDSAPLARIKRSFNEASFRQAAFEMEQMEAARLRSLPPARRAAALTDAGTRFLNQGLILEAEREFQAALAVDSANFAAHAGLAAVRERDGDAGSALLEAQQSLKLQPNEAAYLVLARLDLAANRMPAAADDVSNALRLEPQNAAARGLRQQLETRGQAVP